MDHSGRIGPNPSTLFHTEVLECLDPREHMFLQAKKDELLGLIDRGAFKICHRSEASAHVNITPTRFPTHLLKYRFLSGR